MNEKCNSAPHLWVVLLSRAINKYFKNDLQAAQAISEQRMLDSQKQQIYKIVFLGTSVGFTAFAIFEIGMKVFGYGITKLG